MSSVHPSAIGSATQPSQTESMDTQNRDVQTTGTTNDPSSTNTTTTPAPNNRTESEYSINGMTKISGSGVDDTSNNTDTTGASAPDQNDYPEQRHAGKVGYGPNYNQGAGLGEKLTGIKEQIKGKVSHNPALIEQGRERRTGELKHKQEQEELEASDPFANPEEKEEKAQQQGDSNSEISQTKKDVKGQVDQAATSAPEGTKEAEAQRNSERQVKHIDESN
ncbi:hypothetical protein K435DRAFT_757651 [Dendrothele bispora CBS 962.96]|uniref:CsbD-like domain-containing protein n=1 Tax=Dendrothele bispora (strain CBS 962.96) TaxID=1314807 RepID=A0A4S8LW16_DENBC|nr:hypothetical protein K435DRAFT_757651 [Dendrothele bispora CBS 962.96]